MIIANVPIINFHLGAPSSWHCPLQMSSTSVVECTDFSIICCVNRCGNTWIYFIELLSISSLCTFIPLTTSFICISVSQTLNFSLSLLSVSLSPSLPPLSVSLSHKHWTSLYLFSRCVSPLSVSLSHEHLNSVELSVSSLYISPPLSSCS